MGCIALNQVNEKSQWRLQSVCAIMLCLWRKEEEKKKHSFTQMSNRK